MKKTSLQGFHYKHRLNQGSNQICTVFIRTPTLTNHSYFCFYKEGVY